MWMWSAITAPGGGSPAFPLVRACVEPPPESNRRPHPYHSCGPAPNRSVGAGRSDLSNRELPPGAFRHRPVWHEDGTLAGQPERHAWPCSIATVIVAAAVAAAGVLVSGSLAMDSAGAYTLGPESGRLLVQTSRTGLGAKAGHDLTIAVTRWRGRAMVDTSDPASSSVVVEFEVDSLEVREGTGGVKPLTDADRAQITRTLGEVLHTAQHPTITLRSRQVEGSAASFTVDGELTVMGVTRPVMVQGRVTDGRVVGGATVVRSRANGGSGPTRPSLAPSSSATRSRSTSTSPLLRTVEGASALCLPRSSNSVFAVQRRS
jgi:polyisoprenoid-binding protein YceI